MVLEDGIGVVADATWDGSCQGLSTSASGTKTNAAAQGAIVRHERGDEGG